MKNKSDFVLINPPSPAGKISNKDMMGGFGQLYNRNKNKEEAKIPPIDLAYICGEAKRKELNFFVIDGLGQEISNEEIANEIEKFNPNYVFIRTSTPSFDWDLRLAEKLKNEKFKIFFFGPCISQMKETVINKKEIDGIIITEAEQVIPSIILLGLKKTKGIWFKEKDKIIKNKNISLIKNLDNLAFPAWEYLPYTQYQLGRQINYKTPFVTLLTSRGCPFQCIYCPYPIGQGTQWRFRSAMNVVQEIDDLYHIYGVRGILIRDAVFTLDKERVRVICEELIKRKIQISWRCETRIDCLDTPLIHLMKKAGCIGINLGVESGSKEVLDLLGSRPKNLENLAEFARVCNNIEIDLFLFFIIGLPKERKESIMKTVSWIRKLNVPYVQFTIATPYPGTNLEIWAKKNNYLIEDDSNKITGYECLMRNEKMGPKIIVLLYKYANLMSTLGLKSILKRIKERGLEQIPKETIKIILGIYYYLKIKFAQESK